MSTGPVDYLHPSGSVISDLDLLALNNHRHLSLALGQFQHVLKLYWIGLDIKIGVLRISLPGPGGIGSATFAVYDNFQTHGLFPCMFIVFVYGD